MSKDKSRTADEIIRVITEAFDGVGREDGITLHEADVIDAYGDDRQRAAARKMDIDFQWEDVPDEDIETLASPWPFLDDKGFRYYLPAYMRWAVNHPSSASSEFLSYQLDPYGLAAQGSLR